MNSPIGIRPDSGPIPCFLCGKQAEAHRLCASCAESYRRVQASPSKLRAIAMPAIKAALVHGPYARVGKRRTTLTGPW